MQDGTNAALDISSVNMYVLPYNCPLLLISLPASPVNAMAALPPQHQDTGTDPEVVLGFERFLSDLSARFIRARGEEVDPLVLDGLRSFTILLCVDRCTLTEVEPRSGHTFTRFSYAVDGCTAIPPMRADQLFPWTTAQLLQNRVMILNYPYTFPPEAATDRENAALGKFRSSVHIPIETGGAVRFILSAAAIQEHRLWPELLIPRLRLLGEVIANALIRKEYDDTLRSMKESLESENVSLREVVNSSEEYADIIGKSESLMYVLYRMEQVAPTDATVILRGETGVGKELFARAIHRRSSRKDKPLLKVDCASLSPSLIESELFGHERGAFTGAVTSRKGRFELAAGGTIFLDEVAELPIDLQSRLLRVLQDGTIERLGGGKPTRVNVRIIAATNRNLESDMREGKFRQDLFYRLNAFPLTIPPLRDRHGDIPLLVDHFIQLFNTRHGKHVTRIPAATREMLSQYRWPGNIRELENVIECAVISASGGLLSVPSLTVPSSGQPDVLATLADVERTHILAALEHTLWRIEGNAGAAVILGLHPDTLRYRMKKHNIQRPHPPRS
ncbi:MAG: sigma 54-interacting transcriptional regulator [Ignavibacteriae bacterium]|nr:sigma 54-interacting transcriptional regulator [Ignavibacteriota bacterium]